MAGAALAMALTTWPGAWVPAAGRTAPDSARMLAAVERTVGDGTPRVVGTAAAAAGRERIKALFAEAGVDLEPQEVHLLRSRAGEMHLTNLVGRLQGTERGAGAIAIVAHSDSVRDSPGAGDDASGVAAVLEVAHALRAAPTRHDAVFLLTDGEEAGLLGAEVFMRNHPFAAELRGVVNLDARGASGPAYVFELGPDSGELVPAMARHLSAPRTTSLAAWIYERMPNGTDFTIFRRAGLTGYNVAFIGDYAAYHTPEDTPERLNRSTLRHLGHTALALTRALDAREGGSGSEGDSEGNSAGRGLDERSSQHAGQGGSHSGGERTGGGAGHAADTVQREPGGSATAPLFPELDPTRMAWTDLAGLVIVRWPTPWGPALALAASAVVLIPAVWRALRGAGGRRPLRGIGIAFGAVLACAVAAGVLGWGARSGAEWAGVNLRTAPERTVALFLLLYAAAGVLVAGAGAFMVRRNTAWTTPPAAFAAVWLLWAALAVVSAFLLPAAAPLAVLPVAAAGLGVIAGGMAGTRAMVVAGSLAGLAGTVVVWFPLEPPVLDALGLQMAPAAAARAALVLAPLLPLVLLACGSAPAGHRSS